MTTADVALSCERGMFAAGAVPPPMGRPATLVKALLLEFCAAAALAIGTAANAA